MGNNCHWPSSISAKVPFQYTPTLSPLVNEFSQFKQLTCNGSISVSQAVTSGKKVGLPKASTINENDYKWSLNADITVSQLIFSGSYIVGLQSAKVYKSLSKLSTEKSKEDVLESVTTSYFNVLIATENKVILDSTYQNMIKTLADMQGMRNAGFR